MIRIAHITDFHLRHHLPGTSTATKILSRHMPDILARVVERLRLQKPDLLVVSGDVVDVPPHGLHTRAVQRATEQDLRLVRRLLVRVGCRLCVVPGNHDHYRAMARVFGDLPRTFVCAGHRVLSFWDEETDFHVPRRLLGERERYLAALEQRDLPQIHVQHFLIKPHIGGYPHNYAEADSIAAQLAAHGAVRLALCGHVHAGTALLRAGGVCYSAVPSLCEAPHAYGLYEVDGRRVRRDIHSLGAAFPVARPAVFFDRDGTLSVLPAYWFGPRRMRLIPGVARALRRLKDAGFALVLVSKQSAVGRGFVTPEIVGAVNDRLAELLWCTARVDLDGVYCSYHSPDAVLPALRAEEHPDAKPNPGLLLRAARELQLDLAQSWMVGDRPYDMEAGLRAGLRTLLVKTGFGRALAHALPAGAADAQLADVPAAAAHILTATRA
ncbi:MAG: HAD-IIIA family hydrolase [bacterium]|nr:HAD-IIIA family hydrolase [bacterium]